MKNCIIMGSGRSGTSMVAGVLAKAGYFMGDNLYPPNLRNPKGMFESGTINGINEDILTHNLPEPLDDSCVSPDMNHPRRCQRWLGNITIGTEICASSETKQQIQHLTAQTPYCFKDPRFSYTLPIWRPYLQETLFLCVFRNPLSTAESILRHIRSARHLEGFSMSLEDALQVWISMYRHIVEIHSNEGKWLFLHYNQVLTKEGLDRIAQATGATPDRSFPDRTLNHAAINEQSPEATYNLYKTLCELAEY